MDPLDELLELLEKERADTESEAAPKPSVVPEAYSEAAASAAQDFQLSPQQQRAATKARVRQLRQLLAVFLKAGKTLRLYTRGHGFFDRFSAEFLAMLEVQFRLTEALTFEITPHSINWEGHEIFGNQEQREGLAFKLYRDGVRLLQFRNGVTTEEVREFVTMMAREVDRTGAGSKDLSVLFWEADFKHIQISVAETFVEYTEEAARVLTELRDQVESLQEQFDLQEGLADRPRHEPEAYAADRSGGLHPRLDVEGVDSSDPDGDTELPQLLPEVLDEDRMHRIFDELLGLEDPYATFEEVGVVLAEVVLAETSPGDLAAFLDNLDDALSPLLATAAIGPLNSLLRRLSLLCRETDGPPFRVEALTEFFVRLSRSDRLKLLAGAIDQDWQDEWKGGLFTFVSLQSPSSIDQLVIFLGSIKTLAPRRVVADALLLLSGRQASFFRKLLPLPNWHLVADALYALSKIGDPTSLDSIIGAFARDEHSVRLEVLQALQGYQSPRIQDLMLAGLQDSHQSVRMAALRYLALYRVKEAAGPVQAAITNRQFASRKFEEKRGWFITLGHTGGADLLPQMKKRVRAARGTSTVTEDVHLALLAIRSIRIPEAVSFLTDFAESARGELRVLARQLLGDPRKRS